MTTNKGHRVTLGAITAAIAIITVAWLLSTVQQIPAQSCQVTTYDGHYGTYNECR